jgi:IS30 family transposase
MVKEYRQLRLTERIEIYRLHADGKSLREIAGRTGRSPATISRELRRNSKPCRGWPGGYDPERAQDRTELRRLRGKAYKLERQPELREVVFDQLAMGRSPEQIAGRLTLEQGSPVISHESIYRYIYWRADSFKEKLYNFLPRHKSRRGWRGRKGGSSRKTIFRRHSIDMRPQDVNERKDIGHWEADLMLFSKYGQVLIAHERKSRFTLVLPQPTKESKPVAARLGNALAVFPRRRRQSVTFDNGTEFARHYDLTDIHGIRTWFCDTHSPWQKGGIENAIGRLRRNLPRRTDICSFTKKDLRRIADRFNSTPRKCLGFLTPAEVFFNQRPSQGVALQT